MSKLKTKIPTETWVKATWDSYIQALENETERKEKGYYHNGELRIEMSPVGNDHANDHSFITVAICFFATTKNMTLTVKDNCTYRKTGVKEAQPDVSCYIGENADVVPWGTSIIDLDRYPPPTLAIEVANTSIVDDKGRKRQLYEELQVAEYWIVDVVNVQVIAFAIADGSSEKIRESRVLPGLEISLPNEAFRMSRRMNQIQVLNWLLTQFQQ